MSSKAYKRWRNSVKLTDGTARVEAVDMSVATEEEAQTVERLLGAIQSAFQSAEQTTGAFEVADVQEDLATSTLQDYLGGQAKKVYKKRQPSASASQKIRWVFHDKAELKKLEE